VTKIVKLSPVRRVDTGRIICNGDAVPKVIPALAVVLALAAVPRGAEADDRPFTIGSQPVWFLLGGVTSGGTVALAERGGYVGGELSLARVRRASFFGVYADGYYDWGADGTYVTGGLEVGHKYFGLDGGGALRFVDGEVQKGVAARFTIGLGVLGIYVRYCYFDAMTDDHVLQVGAALKLPFLTLGD